MPRIFKGEKCGADGCEEFAARVDERYRAGLSSIGGRIASIGDRAKAFAARHPRGTYAGTTAAGTFVAVLIGLGLRDKLEVKL